VSESHDDFVRGPAGFIYNRDRLTFAFSVPITLQANRQNYKGVAGDSIFADEVYLANMTYRFGAP